jgi:glycosyltransferase involved in cell wall biosynthesis
MSHRLVIASSAVAVPMGAQVYEHEIAARADGALHSQGGDWQVDRLVVRSLRSSLPGDVRLPVGMLERGGRRLRRSLGRLSYPSGSLVHRMGLGLPPARDEVVTLHDVIAWRFPDEGTPIASAADELRAARAVICVSQATADDAKDMFGLENTRVVHNGVDDRFRDAAALDGATRDRLGISGRFVLHAGGASIRKNLAALADAWASLAPKHPDVTLALAGPEHPRRTELFGGLPQVRLLGRLEGDLVPGLVASAEAVIVPSLYEGFGLPVLEAMAAGTPVIAAATSALPEVAGGAAVLVDPTGEGIAEGVDTVLTGGADLDDLIGRGRSRAAEFTWERAAAEHAQVWTDVS